MPATNSILSLELSPNVILPPMVTSPLTSKFPIISTSSTNCVLSAASNINSPNSNNYGNDSQQGNFYRNDIDQGYNGYQNWENF